MRISIDEVKQNLFTAAEVHAAFKMSLLVKVFGSSSAVFLSYYSIGVNKRIIPSKKFFVFLQLYLPCWATASMESVAFLASFLSR
jgi:hypothetical protein